MRPRTRVRAGAPAVLIAFLGVLVLAPACARKTAPPLPAELAKASRVDINGWINVHLEGTPREIGFQHGWLLAPEIDDLLRALAHFLEGSTKRDWAFFRAAAERLFWPKLDPEYREEIEGIAAGLRARRPDSVRDRIDITALNGWIELAWYYVPYLDAQARPGAGDNKAPGYCSAFIATGSWTEGGGIVMGHNNWVDYVIGARWNVVADIVPAAGQRILMDCLPGAIHSGDDFVVNGAGLVYTETTMGTFRGFREAGTPEFQRARKAAQYAASIDDFVRIMTADNNGAYANDWLVGDTKTGEIAKYELGLLNQRLWRTRDGCFVGSNFPGDEKVIAEETTFDPSDQGQSVLVRKARWEQLMAEYKGYIEVEDAKLFEADHLDLASGRTGFNSNVLCGHVDEDPKGAPELGWAPFAPAGSVQGKVTSTALAKEMKIWARMGHPCGRDFSAAGFLAAHPEYAWQEPYLKDLKASPWTLFQAGK
ncbi:MAG TPA: C45 family autoproteolytic acyltransferase/hydrolase [Candidatus Aminicenantes bacterium]|nr:C45 family autoproteolytic acyltransferase/hydrolase [Candidatus Aminicenantes bacterium]HRY64861.1 C45 family autoproteolytic acyltransferase/hydrolase [Candidatus Aminicenantes bacterium]HRZ71774.1 C45 family autoproteolytic acyltransferase/hydrolase [Candidatus Aminicenantes bacterium]